MAVTKGAVVAGVEPGSPAEMAGVRAGEILREVNGKAVVDLIDYLYLSAGEKLNLTLETGGTLRQVRVRKSYDRNLGLAFDGAVFDRVKTCGNKCPFCFLRGMPKGLRSGVYLRDDDYRLSFLHGNFVTLTNLTPGDLGRILRWNLSPLYVSVHSTDPELRRRILGPPAAGEILPLLDRLRAGGILIHAQVVLCPDLNDGKHLERTLEDLSQRMPGVGSLAVVPAGYTRYHPFPTRPFTRREATDLVRWAKEQQKRFRQFLYLADEFYLQAGLPLPGPRSYGDYPQLENGVGMSTRFATEFRRAYSTDGNLQRPVTILTGKSGYQILGPLIRKTQGPVKVIPVANGFFGERVTVSGLLTGVDIMAALEKIPPEEEVLFPASTLRDGEFLDRVTIAQLQSSRPGKIRAIAPNGEALVIALLGEKVGI